MISISEILYRILQNSLRFCKIGYFNQSSHRKKKLQILHIVFLMTFTQKIAALCLFGMQKRAAEKEHQEELCQDDILSLQKETQVRMVIKWVKKSEPLSCWLQLQSWQHQHHVSTLGFLSAFSWGFGKKNCLSSHGYIRN